MHFRQQVFDVTEAQCEPEIEPDRLLEYLWRKAIAAIAEFLHPLGYRTASGTASPKRRDNAFGKGQPQKWPGFTPPRSRKMPPLRGLLLLRRVHQRIDFVRKNEILAGSFFVRKPSQQGD